MKILVWSILFYLIPLLVCGQASNIPVLSEREKDKIDLVFKDFTLETPGYAIGVSIDGHTVYSNGYGSANLDYKLPITPESSFDIASVSKQFTAAGIALLILNGKLSLETPVSDYIPELSKYADTIRVKHLIYNTSGIVDYYRLPRASGKSWITFNYFDIDECIETSLSIDTLSFKPGSRWDYSNVNFMILAKIAEAVTGLPFSVYLKESLFEPLNMTNSFIHDDVTMVIKNRVTPYNPRTEEYVRAYTEEGINIQNEGQYIQHHRNSPHYGGSGVITTVEDLLKWSKNMITRNLGGDSFYNLMHKTLKFNHERDNQALGLYIGSYKGRKIVAWDGGDYGVSSQLLRFPEHGIAIVVLSNLGSGQAYQKANEIADILIEEKIIE